MLRLALVLVATVIACAPLYVRTKAIQGSKWSALVSGKIDDTAQVELDKRARESCGHNLFEFYCHEPAEDGLVVHWVCGHPKILPSCPPPPQ